MLVGSIQDVRDMARGAVLLGAGGGGDPYIGELFVAAQIKRGNLPRIVASDTLADDAFVLSIAGIGAPSVIVEHLVSEATLRRLLARAERVYGRPVDALISAEIGGANSMFPLALSALSGIPVVDADGVGRAVPQLEMTTFSIYGARATPGVVIDDSGNTVIIEAVDDRMAEELTRAVTTAMGSMAFMALYPMTGRQVREIAVHRPLHPHRAHRRARRVRRAHRLSVRARRPRRADPVRRQDRRCRPRDARQLALGPGDDPGHRPSRRCLRD